MRDAYNINSMVKIDVSRKYYTELNITYFTRKEQLGINYINWDLFFSFIGNHHKLFAYFPNILDMSAPTAWSHREP